MDDRKARQRGEEAKALLGNPMWLEAWDAYRARLLEIIERADSNNVETILQAKRLLAAGNAAKAYLERLMQDGAVAAETIRLEEAREKQQGRWWQRVA